MDRLDQPPPPLGSRLDRLLDRTWTTSWTTPVVRAKLLYPRGAGSGGGPSAGAGRTHPVHPHALSGVIMTLMPW